MTEKKMLYIATPRVYSGVASPYLFIPGNTGNLLN
jgi:hypothetical protein